MNHTRKYYNTQKSLTPNYEQRKWARHGNYSLIQVEIDVISMRNVVMLIDGINQASRMGKENKQEQMKFLEESKRDN